MSIYYVPDAEELLECPYDKVHMIRAKRFQYHLMKCRQNHIVRDFAICPFNAKHEMPKPELRHHMANCPFRATVEREIEYDETRRNGLKSSLKGCTDVPPYNASENDLANDENWDAEIPLHTRMGVDPSFLEGLKYRNTTGMSRSARKEFYQKLIDKEQGIGEQEEPASTALRIPNQKSKAALINPKATKVQSVDVFTYSLSMAGIGRGRGLLTDQSARGIPGLPGKTSSSPIKGPVNPFLLKGSF